VLFSVEIRRHDTHHIREDTTSTRHATTTTEHRHVTRVTTRRPNIEGRGRAPEMRHTHTHAANRSVSIPRHVAGIIASTASPGTRHVNRDEHTMCSRCARAHMRVCVHCGAHQEHTRRQESDLARPPGRGVGWQPALQPRRDKRARGSPSLSLASKRPA